MTTDGMERDEAEELLLDAVDNIATVQNHYEGLTGDMDDMLADSKSGIAAVYTHLDGPVEFDLDCSQDTEGSQ